MTRIADGYFRRNPTLNFLPYSPIRRQIDLICMFGFSLVADVCNVLFHIFLVVKVLVEKPRARLKFVSKQVVC